MNKDQCNGCEYQNDVYQRCIGCGGTRYEPTKVEAARRAGKAEGKAEAFKEIADAMLKRGAIEMTAGHRVAAGVLTEMASALLARAEEVERELSDARRAAAKEER